MCARENNFTVFIVYFFPIFSIALLKSFYWELDKIEICDFRWFQLVLSKLRIHPKLKFFIANDFKTAQKDLELSSFRSISSKLWI